MSTDIKVFGKLVFESASEMAEVAYQVDDGDDSSQELKELIEVGVQSRRNEMLFNVDGALSNDANLWFQDWLSDVAEVARSGSLDTWQEAFGPDKFVRVHAGGREEEVEGSFPETGGARR